MVRAWDTWFKHWKHPNLLILKYLNFSTRTNNALLNVKILEGMIGLE